MTAAGFQFKRPRSRPAGWAMPGPTATFAWLSLLALFLISHLALIAFGLSYESSGGAPYEKIAPGTYLAVLSLIALLIESGDPIGLIDDVVRRHKGAVLFIATWVMLFTYIYVYQGPPLTATFDTFLLPIVLFIVIPRLGGDTRRHMAQFLHLFMAANALLGLAEFAGGFRLTPMIAQGLELTSEWRSSAFLGHPLVNAALTGSYGVMLLMGGGRGIPKGWFIPAFLLQCAGTAVFGGRLATVFFVLAAMMALVWSILRLSAGRRFSLGAAASAAMAIPGLLAALFVLGAGGFFDKFLMRFVEDDGSAGTRVKMFDLIDQISFHDLLVGADPELVATLQRTNGIAFGIESFEVGFIAYYGLLISIPFFIGLVAFCISLARATARGSGWAILYFMIICSGSASLSGKGTLLGLFVAMIVLLMPLMARPPQPARA